MTYHHSHFLAATCISKLFSYQPFFIQVNLCCLIPASLGNSTKFKVKSSYITCFIYLLIYLLGLTAQGLKVCWTPSLTACLKMFTENMFEKDARRRKKIHDCTQTASKLQPSDLHSNAYRSLLGNQDIFSLLISCIVYHNSQGSYSRSQNNVNVVYCITKY